MPSGFGNEGVDAQKLRQKWSLPGIGDWLHYRRKGAAMSVRLSEAGKIVPTDDALVRDQEGLAQQAGRNRSPGYSAFGSRQTELGLRLFDRGTPRRDDLFESLAGNNIKDCDFA